MIKVGIIGCDDRRAAELVRVLINHPDVELVWVAADRLAGTRLDEVIPGIVGECDLTVSGDAAMDGLDVVYLCGTRAQVAARMSTLTVPDNVKIIDLSGCHNLDYGTDADTVWKYGMSEMHRRLLVHDTQRVTMPGSAATAALLALMPMARNRLLNSPVEAHVAMGAHALDDQGKTLDGLSIADWCQDQQLEIGYALGQCQSSPSHPVTLTVTPLAETRPLLAEVRFKCGLDLEMIRQLYEQYYDDHNFVFLVDRPLVGADVENTNKCLLRLEKDEQSGELIIHAVLDVLLKGGAGNAVHAMNLLYGLHELAGLALKGSGG